MLKPDNLPVTFGKNDVEIIARETLYRGFFHLIFIVFVIVYSTGKCPMRCGGKFLSAVTPQSFYPLTQCVMKLC